MHRLDLHLRRAACAVSGGQQAAVRELLKGEGYSATEIERVMARSRARQVIDEIGGILCVRAERRELARRYLLIDVIACRGRIFGRLRASLRC